jgi:hypothetical protein
MSDPIESTPVRCRARSDPSASLSTGHRRPAAQSFPGRDTAATASSDPRVCRPESADGTTRTALLHSDPAMQPGTAIRGAGHERS